METKHPGVFSREFLERAKYLLAKIENCENKHYKEVVKSAPGLEDLARSIENGGMDAQRGLKAIQMMADDKFAEVNPILYGCIQGFVGNHARKPGQRSVGVSMLNKEAIDFFLVAGYR